MGDALQKCTPPQQTQPQTHTKTIIQSVLWRNRSGKMCMQQPGCGFLTNGVGLVGQPTPMCEIMWNSKEIIGNQWNSSEKTAHTNNRQFPTKPFQNNGGCTAQMPPHHSKNNPTHTHTHTHTPRHITQSDFCENPRGQKRCTNTSQSNQTPCEEFIFENNLGQTAVKTPKTIRNSHFPTNFSS